MRADSWIARARRRGRTRGGETTVGFGTACLVATLVPWLGPPAAPSPLPPEGTAPFETSGDPDGPEPRPVKPFGDGPARHDDALDPKTTSMVRVDVLAGAVWRIKAVDTIMTTSVEYGRMHGFSAAFVTSLIVASERNVVRVLDTPIGVGAVARGRLRNHPGYASVGLTAGILLHRAATPDSGVQHRVDPDFTLPIRFAWSVAGVAGPSLSIVQGYSVRRRVYEVRGADVWVRHAYRIGISLGLHLDVVPKRKHRRRSRRRRRARTATHHRSSP
jgi:hypothetical protein